MKRTIVVLLVLSLTLVLALTGCGEKKATQEQRDAITAKLSQCTALIDELVETLEIIILENENIGSTELNNIIEGGAKALVSVGADIDEWKTEIGKNLAKYTPEKADIAIVDLDEILTILNMQNEVFDVALAAIEAAYMEVEGK